MVQHAIFGNDLTADISADQQRILLGMGCFWGAERCFWQLEGVTRTAVGYAGGFSENPTYQQICTGNTGHAEVVEVVYQPDIISTESILKSFWENHDPTQGMRQGNDRGSQYRSMLVCFDEQQLQLIEQSREHYQQKLYADGYATITTELLSDQTFHLAEEDHQQYLHKNPQGYCGLGGTGTCL